MGARDPGARRVLIPRSQNRAGPRLFSEGAWGRGTALAEVPPSRIRPAAAQLDPSSSLLSGGQRTGIGGEHVRSTRPVVTHGWESGSAHGSLAVRAGSRAGGRSHRPASPPASISLLSPTTWLTSPDSRSRLVGSHVFAGPGEEHLAGTGRPIVLRRKSSQRGGPGVGRERGRSLGGPAWPIPFAPALAAIPGPQPGPHLETPRPPRQSPLILMTFLSPGD